VSGLLKATLIRTNSDLHPLEQTLLVQRGNESREYRFGEVGFELLPVKAVAPAVFAIEPELTGGVGEPGRTGDWRSGTSPQAASLLRPARRYHRQLPQSWKSTSHTCSIRQRPTGTSKSPSRAAQVGHCALREWWTLSSAKEEFLKTLAPVSNNPALKIEIRTVAEATARRAPAGPVTVQEMEETADTVAADPELRAYFTKEDPNSPTDELIRSLFVADGEPPYRALFHAIELRNLISRFANIDMRTVAPDARAKWLRMLHQHATAFAKENAACNKRFNRSFYPGSSLHVAEEVSIRAMRTWLAL